MAENRFPEGFGNGQKPRTPQTQQAKPSGKMRKKTLAENFADLLFQGSLNDVKNHLIFNIIVPQIQNAVLEGIKVIFYGESRGGGSNGGSAVKTSYDTYYVVNGQKVITSGGSGQPAAMKNYNPRQYTFSSRVDAEMVLADLQRETSQGKAVSVADFFGHEKIGWTTDWTSVNYGWTNLNGVIIRGCQEGFYIAFPDPVELN